MALLEQYSTRKDLILVRKPTTSHPDKVERIHRSYIEAGADVIQTNTYGANFEKLKSFGLEHKVKEIHQAAVQIAKRAK